MHEFSYPSPECLKVRTTHHERKSIFDHLFLCYYTYTN